ncbi:hypothetical protein DFH07DRAFT_778180 [Mycena maculata]|uniref:Uncharacterized protein n=1 Tax=Mycena maculata TaxID=230809 RepID=A0AAD7N0G0_9AGAR|nr:hypothetical protein DFH07DRAFT_778180 [Mycena maculata]
MYCVGQVPGPLARLIRCETRTEQGISKVRRPAGHSEHGIGADWRHHRVFCQLSKATDPETGGEPPLQRHLRLWTARFNGSLVCATIVALEVSKCPENIDKFAAPPRRGQLAIRFGLGGGDAHGMRLQSMQAQGPDTGPTVTQHRDALKVRSGGQEDYATVMVIVKNLGPRALPRGMTTEIRFKPIGVHQKLTDPTLTWYQGLQVQRDIPVQEMVK